MRKFLAYDGWLTNQHTQSRYTIATADQWLRGKDFLDGASCTLVPVKAD